MESAKDFLQNFWKNAIKFDIFDDLSFFLQVLMCFHIILLLGSSFLRLFLFWYFPDCQLPDSLVKMPNLIEVCKNYDLNKFKQYFLNQ